MVEYLIIVAVVGVAALGLWTVFGGGIGDKTDEEREQIASMTGGASGAGGGTAALTGAEPAPPPDGEDDGGGFWGGVGDVLGGTGDFLWGTATGIVGGAWDTVTGLASLGWSIGEGAWWVVTHPGDAAAGVWHAVTHPVETAEAAWDFGANVVNGIGNALGNAWDTVLHGSWEERGNLLGRGLFEAALTVGTGGAAHATKARFLGKVDDVADAARVAENAGDVAAWRRAAAAGTREASRRIAPRLTVARGTATADDVARVNGALERLPPGVLERLEAHGTKIVVGRDSVTDAVPHLEGVHPRGWPPGKTWDDVDGAYMPGANEVVVATNSRWFGRGRRLTRGDDEFVLYHEVGHALDASAARASRSDDFVRAYEADKGKLSAYERQPGAAGQSEAFAESFRKYVSGDEKFRKTQPHLWEYWNKDPLGIFDEAGGP